MWSVLTCSRIRTLHTHIGEYGKIHLLFVNCSSTCFSPKFTEINSWKIFTNVLNVCQEFVDVFLKSISSVHVCARKIFKNAKKRKRSWTLHRTLHTHIGEHGKIHLLFVNCSSTCFPPKYVCEEFVYVFLKKWKCTWSVLLSVCEFSWFWEFSNMLPGTLCTYKNRLKN